MRWSYLRVVGDLSITTPGNFARRGHHTKIGNVDLDNGTLGQNTKLGIKGVAGVLLDAENGELDRDIEGRVGDVGLLVTETHGPDEAFVLDWASGEIGSDECWLSDDALPALLVHLLARLDDLEKLLFADTLDLRNRDRETSGLLGTLALDLGTARRKRSVSRHRMGPFPTAMTTAIIAITLASTSASAVRFSCVLPFK